jgi:DNA-directed RNA polymerase subunit M/transcription elongation factor TFIIS
MMILKGCDRCSGDLLESSDQYGQYLHCLQCGWHKELKNPSYPPLTETEKTDED